ncbi:hypothetical protein DTO282E5_5425 [Paecilomyces variotii]|nr:hypothetical protein DTO282E5_5425 [Paecilomyces variotii]
MKFDHVVEKQQERKFTAWLKLLLNKSPEILSMQHAAKHRPGELKSACLWRNGAFNICYLVRYEDGLYAIVRFAALGKAILCREKVENEVATMKYLRHITSIPIPEVFSSGISVVGPYIVMSFLEGESLSQLLKDHSAQGQPVLSPQVSNRSLRRAYREMAAIMLKLSRLKFNAIGTLTEYEGRFIVGRRPLTFNMNELMASVNMPEEAFPSHTFKSATDYIESLAL